MTPDNFCYWLKGFIELENPETMTKEQVKEIKRHLNIVFNTGSTTYQTQNYAVPQYTILVEKLKDFSGMAIYWFR